MKISAVAALAVAALAGTSLAQVYNLGNLSATSTNQSIALAPLPGPGPWTSFTLTTDWVAGGGGPWSSEASFSLFNGLATVVPASAPSSGAANNGVSTTLTWTGLFAPVASGTSLDFRFRQTFSGSTATWNNTVLTFGTLTPTLPSNVFNLGSINPAGPLTIQSIGAANDTVIGLWNSSGVLLETDDDDGPGALSLINQTLGLGTYYVGMVEYGNSVTGGAGFGYTMVGGNAAITNGLSVGDGTTTLSSPGESIAVGGVQWYSFTVVPTPGAAALLGLGGLAVARRRR
jgi:hypothetical protein